VSRKVDALVLMLGIGFPLLAIGVVLLVWPTIVSDLLGHGPSPPAIHARIRESLATAAQVDTTLRLARLETGAYPPSAPSPGNEVNAGIEAAATLVYRKDLDLGRRPRTDALGNTDGDRGGSTSTTHGRPDRFEFVDAWGHPFVYLIAADYEAAERDGFPYRNGRGEDVRARPWRDADGRFHHPEDFQLFSMGPDGVPNTEDDLAAFLR
jgi:hypothetical protein